MISLLEIFSLLLIRQWNFDNKKPKKLAKKSAKFEIFQFVLLSPVLFINYFAVAYEYHLSLVYKTITQLLWIYLADL